MRFIWRVLLQVDLDAKVLELINDVGVKGGDITCDCFLLKMFRTGLLQGRHVSDVMSPHLKEQEMGVHLIGSSTASHHELHVAIPVPLQNKIQQEANASGIGVHDEPNFVKT